MADEVPVCDVLCNAIIYLSKLGSNLRTRSETLKDKRIRKEKLKNYHAVQKAADKVLLICELSKKSLENVESGVRKVLTQVTASQQPSADAEKSSRTSTAKDNEYRSFRYRSYNLRISKNVPVKHYMSARVLARNMSLPTHEKYPVYHNCKLYRARKRREKEKLGHSTKELESAKKISNNLGQEKTENFAKSEMNASAPGNSSLDDIRKNTEDVKDACHESKESVSSAEPEKSPNNKKISKRIKRSSQSSQRSNGNNTDEEDYVKRRRNSYLKRNHIIDSDSSDNNSEETRDKSKNCDVKINDKETENVHKSNSSEQVDKESSDHCNSELSSEILKSTNPSLSNSDNGLQVNVKTSEEINKSNDESKDAPVKPLIKCVNINKLLKPDVVKTSKESINDQSKKVIDSKNDQDKSINKENIRQSHTKNKKDIECDDFWALKRKEVSAFVSKKFMIRVIRLPELSESFLNMHNLSKIIHNNKTICKVATELVSKNKGDLNKSRSSSPPSEQINVVKNALLNDSDSEKSDVSGTKSPLPLNEIEQTVKNALNNDADTGNRVLKSPFTELEETVQKVLKSQKALEDDAKTEHEKNKVLESETKTVKDALLHDSESDNETTIKEKQSKVENQLQDKNKQSLLAESDTENIENCKSVRASKDEDTTNHNENGKDKVSRMKPQDEESPTKVTQDKSDEDLQIIPLKKKKHKRKKIMESMHAKKMLLTYSSSSDTEDEQLRSALKEIKDSLLKGISSSDDEKSKEVENCPKSSSEDDDILKRRKQKNNENDEDDNRKKNDSDQSSRSSLKSGVNSKSSRKKMGRSRAQPGGSSQNSDSQDRNDKDIDGLTNLNSLTKNRRRRDSTSTTTDTNSKKSTKMAKTPHIKEDVMLNAEDSSDASAVESDPSEELPSISLSGMNGSGVDHLAKDDLLNESDTSVSHREDSDVKKTDDSDEEAVKSKRRKAHLISSDSEAGSSRRNLDKPVKLSDFEDSEDENSEPAKKSKRKKKGEESDASAGSSSSNDGSKKKRRRIKTIDSDASGSDTENEGRNKHGRKNIRKVMGKNQLEEATKKAAREEKERIARIAERQKLYNNLEFDESGKPDEVVLEKVVLDFDPETKEPLIQVDRGLVKKLKPHQANGIKFMWDACFESVKRIKKDKGSGCILAHCMGLGKTLQVVSLTHTLLTHSELTSVSRVLVVCPLSTVLNWVNEFNMWLKHTEKDFPVDVYELSRHKQNSERAFQLQQWFEGGGVCVLGYEMFRNLSADNPKKFKKKMLRHFQESLVDPGPDLVVCDEGHLLKNEKTSLSQSMNRVKTRRRIVLTGTPLQNNLKEYYCMVQFVKPNLLGKYNEYLNRFVNPITNGQYTDSTEHDIRIMKRRSHVLHKMLDGAVQRRDYGVLAPFLPPKHEYVLFITLTDVQVKLYQFYLDNYSRRPLPGKSSGFLFPDFQSLQRIWTHPLVLKYNSERYEIMQQKKREREEEDSEGSLVDFIDDDSTPEESSTEESTDDLSDMSDDSRKKSKKKKSAKKSKGKDTKVSTRRGTRANPVEMEEDVPTELPELKNENPTEWWIRLVEEEELEDLRNSHKLVLLFDILRQCETIGDKLLVFSQSLYSLDLIEHFLGKVDEATQDGRIDEKLGSHVGSWSPGIDYFRLDGSTSCENRSIWCKNFNREDNPRARLFLISTRAGGLGINLVAANRVVIFDVSWNPSHDVQSIFRVYRFGQKKPCYIYRFLAMGTMEEKIYERQVTKQAISKRVIDEQQIDRHYAENDLAELYKFEASPPSPRPLPPLPKDRLFAEMLREHEAQIYKYHEHDSLLENKEEETLSEEERKAAWEDFENEKNRPPPAPFPSAWPMHNGMVPGLLAQQQQQLAYAALAAMLRKDMPNINDNQIRDMMPLIYNANPAMFGGYDYGLMQKMSEIYKYSQPGMMNPMMNPVMNAAAGGGAGGGMGGTSGLQYEPPWQRQHQQQQQMRLQQLLQQNQMGAKYYAGGLGSRDPVAMALQQQRAREIMSGERGRPRGRPPLQPRAPMPPSGDVVNLDSD